MSRPASRRVDAEGGAPSGKDAQAEAAAIDAQLQTITGNVVKWAVLMAAIHGPGERFKTTLREVLTRELESLQPALLGGAQEERRRSALHRKRTRAPTASEIEFITKYLTPSTTKRHRALMQALGREPPPAANFAQVRDSLGPRLSALKQDLRGMSPDDPQREHVQRQIDALQPMWDVSRLSTARLIELSARVHEHLTATTRLRDECAPPEWWHGAPQDDTDDPRFL